MLDVTVDAADLDRAARCGPTSATERPPSTGARDEVALPVDSGVEALVEAVRRLDDGRIKVVDLALRRPSLDDVFLALTGHTTGDDGGVEPKLTEAAR